MLDGLRHREHEDVDLAVKHSLQPERPICPHPHLVVLAVVDEGVPGEGRDVEHLMLELGAKQWAAVPVMPATIPSRGERDASRLG